MHLKESVVIATEDEGEGVQRQVAAKPDIFRRVDLKPGFEESLVGPPDESIDAIGADEQIGALELLDIRDFPPELDTDAERLATAIRGGEDLTDAG